MSAVFPSIEWQEELKEKLNNDKLVDYKIDKILMKPIVRFDLATTVRTIIDNKKIKK